MRPDYNATRSRTKAQFAWGGRLGKWRAHDKPARGSYKSWQGTGQPYPGSPVQPETEFRLAEALDAISSRIHAQRVVRSASYCSFVIYDVLFACRTNREVEMYTVAELAQAVGKTENFVRQHIHRGHLVPQKEGRRIHVTNDEAIRWCQARGLVLSPASGLPVEPLAGDRVARLTVAAYRNADGSYVNAFTLVRLRGREHLGPWNGTPDGQWRREDVGHGFELFSLDSDPGHCEELISAAVNSGRMTLDDRVCQYDLLGSPRSYWAYRDYRGDQDDPIPSPFSAHSAEVREYWARDGDSRLLLTEAVDALPPTWNGFASLGFSLLDRADRLGNLAVASAWDRITCKLSAAQHTNSLALDIAGNFMPDEYKTTVWAAGSGDAFFHRQLPATSGRTKIALPMTPDRIGVQVLRSSDGQCVDYMDANLIMGFNVRIDASTGPALNLTDPDGNRICEVNPVRSRSRVVVSTDDQAPEVDRIVRTRSLGHRAAKSEAAARRQGTVARYKPNAFADTVAHFARLLSEDTDPSGPVYLADRYFLAKIEGVQGVQLYARMLEATVGREFRVLCTQPPKEHPNAWWQTLPTALTSHLVVRSFLTNDPIPQPAFHDRYIITPNRETLMTHSLNGWARDGVTFVTLPFAVYRSEAEYLWSIDLRSTSAPLLVEEYAS